MMSEPRETRDLQNVAVQLGPINCRANVLFGHGITLQLYGNYHADVYEMFSQRKLLRVFNGDRSFSVNVIVTNIGFHKELSTEVGLMDSGALTWFRA